MTSYEREMRLMPHILKMERTGINLDIGQLSIDTNFYYNKLAWLDTQISEILKTKVDIDSNEDLANAIEARGLSKGFAQTPTGKRSVAKESLLGAIADPQLLGHLLCRGAIATCVRTFYSPWLAQAREHGKLYIKWNQIRNYTDTGARTGRLSSSPNLQNIPVTWEKLTKQLNSIGYKPDFPLPLMRQYIVPPTGYVFIGRDYSAQEMRLLAHFAGGGLLETIQEKPEEDIHQIAAKIAGISRSEAKTLGFAVLYGAGVGRIAESLGISVAAASSIKAQYLARLPEIKRFTKELGELSARGEPIQTLAGRCYHAQTPSVVQGRLRTFEYKLVNYKIQGSAADQTKEAMYQYATTTKHGLLQMSVHDQVIIAAPEERVEEERVILEEAVNQAFQTTLRYTVISTESYNAPNLGELKTDGDRRVGVVSGRDGQEPFPKDT